MERFGLKMSTYELFLTEINSGMVSPVEIIVQDYHDHEAISNSDIGLFLSSPQKYYKKKYTDETVRKESSGFEVGTQFDRYILDYDNFKKEYVLEKPMEKPSHVTHQTYCEARINGYGKTKAHDEAFSSNKSDSKIQEKIEEMEEKYGQYIEFQKEHGDSPSYTEDQSKLLSDMKMAVLNHKAARRLLLDDNVDRFNHLALHIDHPFWNIRGEIDNLVIDDEKKIVYLTDLKTTGKPVGGFKWEILRYNYHRQLANYSLLAAAFVHANYEIPYDKLHEWTMIPGFIAVETTANPEVRYVVLPPGAIRDGIVELNKAISDIHYHKEIEGWNYRKQYYQNSLGAELFEDYEPEHDWQEIHESN